eukprot:581506-Hanusia_phi.AAC.1
MQRCMYELSYIPDTPEGTGNKLRKTREMTREIRNQDSFKYLLSTITPTERLTHTQHALFISTKQHTNSQILTRRSRGRRALTWPSLSAVRVETPDSFVPRACLLVLKRNDEPLVVRSLPATPVGPGALLLRKRPFCDNGSRRASEDLRELQISCQPDRAWRLSCTCLAPVLFL